MSNLQHELGIFEIVILNTMKRLQILQKLVYKKFYVQENILHTRNCCHRFIKNLLPEKHTENI